MLFHMKAFLQTTCDPPGGGNFPKLSDLWSSVEERVEGWAGAFYLRMESLPMTIDNLSISARGSRIGKGIAGCVQKHEFRHLARARAFFAKLNQLMRATEHKNVLGYFPLQLTVISGGLAFIIYGSLVLALAASSTEFPNWSVVAEVLVGAFRIVLGCCSLLAATSMWPEWVEIFTLGVQVLLISRSVDVVFRWIEAAAGVNQDVQWGFVLLDTFIAIFLVSLFCFWVLGLLNSLKCVLLVGGTGWERLNFESLQIAFERGELQPRSHKKLPVFVRKVRRIESVHLVLERSATRNAGKVDRPCDTVGTEGVESHPPPDFVADTAGHELPPSGVSFSDKDTLPTPATVLCDSGSSLGNLTADCCEADPDSRTMCSVPPV